MNDAGLFDVGGQRSFGGACGETMRVDQSIGHEFRSQENVAAVLLYSVRSYGDGKSSSAIVKISVSSGESWEIGLLQSSFVEGCCIFEETEAIVNLRYDGRRFCWYAYTALIVTHVQKASILPYCIS